MTVNHNQAGEINYITANQYIINTISREIIKDANERIKMLNDDGSFSGATYSNEWDIFEFVANANGEFNVELTESATFKIFDANNTLLNDNLAVEGNKYYLAVNVTSDLNKANDKDNTFSGIITIA